MTKSLLRGVIAVDLSCHLCSAKADRLPQSTLLRRLVTMIRPLRSALRRADQRLELRNQWDLD